MNSKKIIELCIKQHQSQKLARKILVYHIAKKQYFFLIKHFKDNNAEDLSKMIEQNVKRSKLKLMLQKLWRYKYVSFVAELHRYEVEMAQ